MILTRLPVLTSFLALALVRAWVWLWLLLGLRQSKPFTGSGRSRGGAVKTDRARNNFDAAQGLGVDDAARKAQQRAASLARV